MVAGNRDIEIETVHGVKFRVPPGWRANRTSDLSSPLFVLVIDDCAVNRRLLTSMLEKENCDYLIAGNGLDGINLFKRHAFDLVITDVEMPVMNGIAVTRVIRQIDAQSGAHTPIVTLTAGASSEACLQAGADRYLKKPVSLAVLRPVLVAVRMRISNARRRRHA